MSHFLFALCSPPRSYLFLSSRLFSLFALCPKSIPPSFCSRFFRSSRFVHFFYQAYFRALFSLFTLHSFLTNLIDSSLFITRSAPHTMYPCLTHNVCAFFPMLSKFADPLEFKCLIIGGPLWRLKGQLGPLLKRPTWAPHRHTLTLHRPT